MKRKNKRKNKKIKYTVLLSISIVIGVIIYIRYLNKDILEYKTKITIEVGETIPTAKDYIYKKEYKDGQIIWEEEFQLIENKIYKTGTYNGTLTYKEKEKEIILVVEDTKKPQIKGIRDLEMLAYEQLPNLLDGIEVIDNSKEKIEAVVEGEYDTEKVGKYTLIYTATDSSGNDTKQKTILTVKENPNVKISKTQKGNVIKNYHGITYIDNTIIVNKTYNLPSNFAPNNLTTINGYIQIVDYVKSAFAELTSDSKSIGLNIYASSGYRSYNDQKYIYNNYVKIDGQETADTYSARAGHSEHQTGLAIDVNTIDSSFEGTSESEWLKNNCYKYGFIIRYPKGKDTITGYMYEPWHIRYVGKALASKLYNNGNWITLEEYYGIDSKYK